MKIAVVTNYDTTNYGSILQAFALQTKLKEYGADTYVLQKVNASKRTITSRFKKFFSPSKNYTIKDRYEIKRARKLFAPKNRKLRKFCNDNIKSKICYSAEGAGLIVGDTDIMIAGSDQIWSTTATMLSDFTTLQFGPKRIKRYSYAASVGTASLDDNAQLLLKNGLSDFSGISLRENSSIPLIKTVCNKNVHWNIDPTFLYDSSFWDNYVTAPEKSQKYIFVYMLRPEPLAMSMAKALSEKTGFKIFLISNRIINDESVNNITDAGLQDFLGYIKNAEYVVTNSFHGTAFAVQFKKQFMSVAVAGSGMRVTDFLTEIGLNNRIASDVADINKIDNKIEWSEAEQKIGLLRSSAFEYIDSIINSCESLPIITKGSMPVLFRDKAECCGCGACRNACPKNAISMVEDENGFVYPQINEGLCIHCGACKRVCNYQNGNKQNNVLNTYAAVSEKENTRLKSSSGGAFASIAEKFIEDGGVVFGCAMLEKERGLTPAHICIDKTEDIIKLQSSKYSQSDIGTSYKSAKDYLKAGKKVLFSGTPCQIAGLRGYLNNVDYENLFVIDIICHGVPSTAILQDYIKMIEDKKNIHIKGINFRDKKYGWGVKGSIPYTDSDNNTGKAKSSQEKELYFDNYTSSFYNLYLKAGFYRENCYSCRYANKHRVGDITLGDYWGITQQHPEFLTTNGGDWNTNQGISCILTNTVQGEKLLQKYGTLLDMKDSSFEKVSQKNKMLSMPSRVNGNRTTILKLYQNEGYQAVDKWFWQKFGMRNFIYGKWDKMPSKYTKKIKSLKKLVKR